MGYVLFFAESQKNMPFIQHTEWMNKDLLFKSISFYIHQLLSKSKAYFLQGFLNMLLYISEDNPYLVALFKFCPSELSTNLISTLILCSSIFILCFEINKQQTVYTKVTDSS